ncbi:transposase, partial [Corynebacterium striatum]
SSGPITGTNSYTTLTDATLQQYGTGKRARTKAMRDNAKETTDSERIRQLEKEVSKLREERDILRKAAKYFA